jgi:4-amino-4-deoxy-L-arabinose transferase-like glycosyltransferase
VIKNKKLIFVLLFVIVLIGGILRLWQLGNTPPSPDWDEAAIGYDAYSLLNTSHDQFGKFMPVVMRSLDDYKPALYAYLAVPSIAVFGLNTFAVRLPSAIFGILSIIIVFYLMRELFANSKYKDYLSLIVSLLLAISPWSIQFSRVGFESNVGTVFNILTALFFIKGLKKPWLLSLSAICACLSIYAYQSEKVFTPLLVLALVVIFRQKLFSINKKYLAPAFLIGALVILPMLFYIVTNRSSLERLTGTSIFASQTQLLQTDTQNLISDKANHDLLGEVLDNRRIVYAKAVVSGYIVHFDPNWLFIEGDNPRHHAPDMGLLYLFEMPLIALGIYMLAFGDFDKTTKLLVFGWMLLAPVPASITTGVPHAVRTMNFLPTWQIFSGLGLVTVYLFIKRYKELNSKYLKIAKYAIYGLFLLVAAVNVIYYLNQYFVQQNYYNSAYWQYGYQQAVSEVVANQSKYKEVVVENSGNFDKSYIFFLFYLKYPPQEYQAIAKNRPVNIVNNAFGKYVFRPIDWQKDSSQKNVLYVGTPSDFSGKVNVLKIINNLDGTPAVEIVGT